MQVGDRFLFYFPHPHCGEMQILTYSHYNMACSVSACLLITCSSCGLATRILRHPKPRRELVPRLLSVVLCGVINLANGPCMTQASQTSYISYLSYNLYGILQRAYISRNPPTFFINRTYSVKGLNPGVISKEVEFDRPGERSSE